MASDVHSIRLDPNLADRIQRSYTVLIVHHCIGRLIGRYIGELKKALGCYIV